MINIATRSIIKDNSYCEIIPVNYYVYGEEFYPWYDEDHSMIG